ncbi:serine carboxypeptidase [Trichoderma citrinoviride]|uniref:Carboxypeptidase n=1 Tax=Trichoderma citrinoviride TaxID=58853 RepID=A0A2T4B6N7_9HYPO|nr:serine carboxypeptidase [Trichoderma citrinoviride]PTB64899.1 serine carboxypeptidase [Trichoderma citrinoviride]
MLSAAVLLGGLSSLALAQFPPKPEGVTVLRSKFHENVTISFKEPGICETTPGVKSYAGHVHLPPRLLEDADGEPQNYPVNTFFWFFEARENPSTAPLAIWLNGGPGASSLLGLLMENGPCFVNEDSKSTMLNPWSWNNEVNMLYIDEPNQVGFSYDTPTNCTANLSPDGLILNPADFSAQLPELNLTSMVGTFSSQKPTHTTNSTAQAAHALWHFAQAWFSEFPHYKPSDDRISIWAESYGGHYGPGFMRFFQQQNEKIADGTIKDEHAHYLHLDTLGIVNGWLDSLIQEEAYIDFPYNNTYGIQVFNQSIYEELKHNFTKPKGCREQIERCQKSLSLFDVATVNAQRVNFVDLCEMESWCKSPAASTYLSLDSGWFDISHPVRDPFPPSHAYGYLTEESVLGALGSPVNFTAVSAAVSNNFISSYDEFHGDFIDAVGYLLDHGVKVHMMYGDRDYACNWIGGERASLAVPYSHADDFARAGYAPLITDKGVAGLTRQYGNYSFSRVFQAGHMVPSYQPEAAYEIFMRATFNRDIPTGLLPVRDDLSTDGPSDTWHVRHEPPEAPAPRCYILAPQTCVSELWEKVVAGTARVKDWYAEEEAEEEQFSEEL